MKRGDSLGVIHRRLAELYACSSCGADVGSPCQVADGGWTGYAHAARYAAADDAARTERIRAELTAAPGVGDTETGTP